MNTLRAIIFTLPVLSLFWFPYPYSVALSFLASLFAPWYGITFGIVADIFYLSSPQMSALPLASGIGGVLSIISLFVRRFVKTRII